MGDGTRSRNRESIMGMRDQVGGEIWFGLLELLVLTDVMWNKEHTAFNPNSLQSRL